LVDWSKIPDRIRQLVRGKQGLPLDDDLFQGLIHTTDDRERTRLSTRNVYRHAYMNLLAKIGGDGLDGSDGDEWEAMRLWAEEERHLFIAEEGARAEAFINALARKQQEQVPITNITMQNQPLGQQPQQEQKKGWLHR
jgi:hypothetical protein